MLAKWRLPRKQNSEADKVEITNYAESAANFNQIAYLPFKKIKKTFAFTHLRLS